MRGDIKEGIWVLDGIVSEVQEEDYLPIWFLYLLGYFEWETYESFCKFILIYIFSS